MNISNSANSLALDRSSNASMGNYGSQKLPSQLFLNDAPRKQRRVWFSRRPRSTSTRRSSSWRSPSSRKRIPTEPHLKTPSTVRNSPPFANSLSKRCTCCSKTSRSPRPMPATSRRSKKMRIRGEIVEALKRPRPRSSEGHLRTATFGPASLPCTGRQVLKSVGSISGMPFSRR